MRQPRVAGVRISGPGALATILLWFGPIHIASQPSMFLGLLVAAALVLVIALVLMWLASLRWGPSGSDRR